MTNYLIIGYGNTLRSDDGAGQKVATIVAAWKLKNVRSLAVQQLTPELAADIAEAEAVIFVDAIAASKNPQVTIQNLESGDNHYSCGHSFNPRSLLNFTQAVYGRVPPSYWLLIPAENFEFGETLSLTTQNGIKLALNKLQEMVNK